MPLVRRTTRSVGLTEAGQQLVDATQGAFTSIEQSFSSIKDLAGMPRGLVRVTAPVALGRQHIAPDPGGVPARQPGDPARTRPRRPLVNLAQEGFDLAIRHCQAPPDTHVAWVLCPSRSLLVASSDYLRRHGTPAHPNELGAHQCLLYLRDAPGQSWSFERQGGRKPERVIVAGQRALARQQQRSAARGGVGRRWGSGCCRISARPAYLGPRQLVRVLPQWQPRGFFGERLYAIRPWAPQVPRAVQCFVDHLRQALAPGFDA